MTSTVTNSNNRKKHHKERILAIDCYDKIGDDAFSFYNVVLMCALLFFR